MQEIGQKLKERREELGLSLRDVQKQTKIRTRWLEALELGDRDSFPAQVYMKGFLKSYADALGLDGSSMVQELRAQEAAQEKEKKRPRKEEPPPGARDKPRGRSDTRRLADLLDRSPRRSSRLPLTLIALLLVAAAIWWLWQEGGDTAVEQPPDPVADNGNQEKPAEDPPQPDPDPEPRLIVETQRVSPVELRVTVSGAESLEIFAQARPGQNCWIRAVADGDLLAEETLRTGASRSWQAGSEFLLRAGNPPGLSVTVNGRDLGRLEADVPLNIRIFLEKDS